MDHEVTVDRGQWVRYFECRECGSEIEEGESCDCTDEPDDSFEPEEETADDEDPIDYGRHNDI